MRAPHELIGVVDWIRAKTRVKLPAVIVGMLLCGLLGSGAASAAEPTWRIDTLANSTAAPGANLTYVVQVTNVGNAPAAGFIDPIVLTITLPGGMKGASAGSTAFNGFSCTAGDGTSPVAEATTIRCTSSGFIFLNQFTQAPVTVAVAGTASGVLTSSFSITGGGTAQSSTTVDPTRILHSPPPFGLDAFDGQVTADAAGAPLTQAGAHPYSASTSIDFNTVGNPVLEDIPTFGIGWPAEPVKDVVVDLPAGFVGNPTVAAMCSAADLANGFSLSSLPLCSPNSQVGTTFIRTRVASITLGPVPVFNMVPPPGVPARFGFAVSGTVVTFDVRVRSGSDFGISAHVRNISEGLAIAGTTLTLWGIPADPSHDPERTCPGTGHLGCSSGTSPAAFLRNPTRCSAPTEAPIDDGLITGLHIDSWIHPGGQAPDGTPNLSDPAWHSANFVSHLPPAYPFPSEGWGPNQLPTGCDQVPFDPALKARPSEPARAGSPSGFIFDLTLPQSDDPTAIGEGDLKKAVVTLPAGVRVSPSSAEGLQGCSPSEIRLHTSSDPSCPAHSKLGSVTIKTPLLDDPLTGSIYLATPHDNPFGSLIAVYLVAKGSGITIKLAGEAHADPVTGQLSTTFDDNPQTPFSSLHLEFDGGPRAPLVTPKECGTYTTHAVLTSWSGKTVESNSHFTIDKGPDGGPCAASGFSPGFSAGTENPVAGADSPFLLLLTRSDRDQELSSLAVDMPTGLLGRIASTVLCPDAAANAGTCTDGSKIGRVTVGAGAGSNPFYISTGRAYITGPYRGAPFGLSIVVPAVAGPFDLGNVVVRSAIFVNRHNAALKVVSDPLPTILEGIPLDVRDVRVLVDRKHFFLNPTSCAPKQIRATVGSTQGAVARVGSRFRATDCVGLPLSPKLVITVGAKGRTSPGHSTPLTTVLTQPSGQTNLRSVSVTLPGTLNALLPVINRACKLAAFEAGHCGAGAKAGTAVAVTPLLRDPLRGPVYFVKNPARVLPDLVVALRGQISFDLVGKVSIPGGKQLGTRFDAIPDAPIKKFTLRLVAGRNGPLGVARNLCTRKGRAALATIGMRGQSNRLIQVRQRLRVKGCPHRRR
jgi:uncharacterized repeat protein (TIGR01451 family)